MSNRHQPLLTQVVRVAGLLRLLGLLCGPWILGGWIYSTSCRAAEGIRGGGGGRSLLGSLLVPTAPTG